MYNYNLVSIAMVIIAVVQVVVIHVLVKPRLKNPVQEMAVLNMTYVSSAILVGMAAVFYFKIL